MGVPALFRWLSNKYPKIISPVIEESSEAIDGQEIPVDISKPNPNGMEYDNLYLDMNAIVHPCSHPEDRPAPENEEQMMQAIFEYMDRVVNMVRPRKILYMAVDGVAPRAKMNQQRSRRFRSAQEAAQADEDKAELVKLLKSQAGEKWEDGKEEAITKKTWDSNQITPGTPFMFVLAESLRYWAAYKLNTDPGWEKLKVIVSDASVPGEGEHKIMEFIRSQRASPFHDPNTRHVMYGLDADLIMLGLATHEPHFHILREDVFFQEAKGRTCRLCGQPGHKAEECRGEAKQKEGEHDEKDKVVPKKPFIWLHVPALREYLAIEMSGSGQRFAFDLERALDDWVFMCFFCGNDFLPHLPSLEIRENGIDTLIDIWRQALPSLDGYVTEDGHVHLQRAQFILDGLAQQEDSIFKRRRENDERQEARNKRRKLDQERREESRNGQRYRQPSTNNASALSQSASEPMPLYAPGKGETLKDAKSITHDMAVNRGPGRDADLANKSAAAMLKSKLLGKQEEPQPSADDSAPSNGADASLPALLGKRKAELMEADDTSTPGTSTPNEETPGKKEDEGPPPDTVRLWESGYADRYYEQKFGKGPEDIAFRNKVASAYVEGLAWVLLYYFQGCPSWSWFYPYHYAPFAADFVDIHQTNLEFDKNAPLRPYEQLMSVLPAASNSAIPKPFRSLMSDEDSEIIDFYPTDFEIDLNGKRMAWQGVALLPFIEIDRLLAAMANRYPLLSADEVARNDRGREALLFSDRHPMFADVAANFFSKRQGAEKLKLNMKKSEGLAGNVERVPEFLPEGPLLYPFESAEMPNLDADKSISVYYDMPHSSNIHKSMLLSGVNMPTPVLTREDIEIAKDSLGRNGSRNGRGGYHGGGRGRGRGGGYGGGGGGQRDNFQPRDSRPNPFAAHIQPGFVPPPPPPAHLAQGYNGWPGPPQGGYQGYHQQPQRNGNDYNQSYNNRGPQSYGNNWNGHRGSAPPPQARQPYQQQGYYPPQHQNYQPPYGNYRR